MLNIMFTMQDMKKRLSEEKGKQEELEKSRVETTKQIVNNLKNQKRIEKEHLDIVEEHLKYWKKQIEETSDFDEERIKELKERLKIEEKVYNKIKDHMDHLDKEIKFQKEHLP